jgi:hypothetical protein
MGFKESPGMKKTVGLLILIVGLAAAIYVTLHRPRPTPSPPAAPPPRQEPTRVETAKPTNADLEMQEKCARMSEELFRKLGLDAAGGSYRCHYNKKTNRFYMTTIQTSSDGGKVREERKLFDVMESKTLGEYARFSPRAGRIFKGAEASSCTIAGEARNMTIGEYEAFVKPYMED